MTYQTLIPTSLRELRQGAMLHVLVALSMLDRPASITELVDETGWSDDKVAEALRLLHSPRRNLVIAIPDGRHCKWQLAATARQLLLSLNLTPRIADSAGGSSGLIEDPQYESLIATTTTTPVTPRIAESTPELSTGHPQPDLPLGVRLLVQSLKDLGCPGGRAVAAVTQALNRGESAQAVAEKIVAGKAYATSPAGRTIRSPGHWLAACLADGRAIPAPREEQVPDSERDYDGYLPYADSASQADVDTPYA